MYVEPVATERPSDVTEDARGGGIVLRAATPAHAEGPEPRTAWRLDTKGAGDL